MALAIGSTFPTKSLVSNVTSSVIHLPSVPSTESSHRHFPHRYSRFIDCHSSQIEVPHTSRPPIRPVN